MDLQLPQGPGDCSEPLPQPIRKVQQVLLVCLLRKLQRRLQGHNVQDLAENAHGLCKTTGNRL